MKAIKFLTLLIAMSALTSCATVFSGSHQTLTIDSEPPGAEVFIKGRNIGTTPVDLVVDREFSDLVNGGKSIYIEKEGYRRSHYLLTANLNPISIVNLANIVCWAIDAATGSITRYDRYHYFRLQPERAQTSFNMDSNNA